MKLNCGDAVTLGLGALLHDVGKSWVADFILNKQDKLTDDEFDIIKMHPAYGVKILKNIPNINSDVLRIVLEHHERCDGSGYPKGLRGNRLHLFSKIVAIADIFDALTSERIHQKKILPHEAAEYLLSVSGRQLDHDLVQIFTKTIAVYPKGCQVLLSTNQVAVVIASNPLMPLRPILKVLTDTQGIPLQKKSFLDLSRNFNVFITHLFG